MVRYVYGVFPNQKINQIGQQYHMLKQLFRGNKLRLTALRDSDAESMRQWTEDSVFANLASSNAAYPRTDKQIKERIESSQSGKNGYYFAMRPLDDERLLGLVSLGEIEWNNGVGWVGIEIGDTQNRGQGYGTEAMSLLLDYAFLELNFRKVQLSVFDYNQPAIAIYEKLGFVQEGTLREFGVRFNTTYDMLFYGILRREWLSQYPMGYVGSLES